MPEQGEEQLKLSPTIWKKKTYLNAKKGSQGILRMA
jgi:hypothetical protein